MKAILAVTFLLASSFAWGAANPADYTVNVHVVSSRLESAYWVKFPIVISYWTL